VASVVAAAAAQAAASGPLVATDLPTGQAKQQSTQPSDPTRPASSSP
jgi:hypothetical protein